MLINYVWIISDNASLPPSDTYIFLTQLLSFIDRFSLESLAELFAQVSELSHLGRPPLYQLLTAPFILVFGRSADAALAVNFIFLPLLLLATYGLGRLVNNGRAGLLAAFLVACYPPIVFFSRTYLPHFGSIACGALSLWLLALLIESRSTRHAWLFGGSLAFGLLVHPNFIYLLAVPTVLAGFYLLLFQEQPRCPASVKAAPAWLLEKVSDRFCVRGLLPGALITMAGVLPWYLTVGSQLLDSRRRFQADGISMFRGVTIKTFGFPEVDPSFWWYLKTAPHVITYFFTGLLVASLLFAMMRWQPVRWLLVLTLLATYTRLSLSTSRRWVACSLILPAAAVLTSAMVTSIRPKWLSNTVVAVCVMVGAFTYSIMTWGVEPWGRPLASALGAQLDTGTCRAPNLPAFCSRPATTSESSWPIGEIAEKLVEDPACQRPRPCRVLLVKTEDMWNNKLYYYMLERYAGLNVAMTTVGVSTWGRRYNAQALLGSNFYLFPYGQRRGLRLPGPSSAIDYREATLRLLEDPPAAFSSTVEKVAVFSVPRGEKAVLMKRTRPLTRAAARATLAALELDSRYLPGKSREHQAAKANRLVRSAGSESVGSATGTGDATDSIAELKRAISQAPDDVRSRIRLADMYRTQENYDRAASLYREALEIDPDHLGARIGLARVFAQTGEAELATAELERAIVPAPRTPWPRKRVADIYLSLGDDAKALSLYREALEIEPDFVAARVGLATIYRQDGELDAAAAELEQAVVSAPENVRARRALADLYRTLGNTARARALYQEILKIDPEDTRARRALAGIGG